MSISFQSLEIRDRLGRLLRANGSPAPTNELALEPKKVLQHLVFENRMYYREGWIIRDEVFEDVTTSTIDASEL